MRDYQRDFLDLAVDIGVQPFTQGIDTTHTHAMQTTGHLVAV